jgi:hypothetical protein
MNTENEYTFITSTGTCTVSRGRLVFTRQAPAGKLARLMWGKSIYRGLAIYGAGGLLALALGIWLLIHGSTAYGVLFGVVAAYLFWNVIASWNNSGANSIERPAVQSVEARPPRPPGMRGYFIVYFTEKDKKRKRLIMLPGSKFGGDEEYPKALAAMKEAGWL